MACQTVLRVSKERVGLCLWARYLFTKLPATVYNEAVVGLTKSENYLSSCSRLTTGVLKNKSESHAGHVVSGCYPRHGIRGPGMVRFLSSMSEKELRMSIDRITEKFMEARELLDDAKSSVGTVYSRDDVEEARCAVTEALDTYQDLLQRVTVEQEQLVRRTIGLKMEELRAQLRALEDSLKD